MANNQNQPARPIYVVPSTRSIAEAQNSFSCLRLLLTQRKTHSIAKTWAMLRGLGVGVVAIAAPILTFVSPTSAVFIGAVAGVWIVLSRTLFASFEAHYSGRGAVIQEYFDMTIFGMLPAPMRVPELTPELVSRTVGADDVALATIDRQSLRDWYPLDLELNGAAAIAIAQRANAAYSERLLTLNARLWLALTLIWSLATIALSLALGLKLETCLLGVVLPLLPALLDVIDQWRHTRQASKERLNLANTIEDAIKNARDEPINPEDLLVWQDQLFALRRDAPQVSNLLYWLTRAKNEIAMNAGARDLSDVAKKIDSRRTNTLKDQTE